VAEPKLAVAEDNGNGPDTADTTAAAYIASEEPACGAGDGTLLTASALKLWAAVLAHPLANLGS
jgi:hypothetical protein